MVMIMARSGSEARLGRLSRATILQPEVSIGNSLNIWSSPLIPPPIFDGLEEDRRCFGAVVDVVFRMLSKAGLSI